MNKRRKKKKKKKEMNKKTLRKRKKITIKMIKIKEKYHLLLHKNQDRHLINHLPPEKNLHTIIILDIIDIRKNPVIVNMSIIEEIKVSL